MSNSEWSEISLLLREKVGKAKYDQWFEPIECYSISSQTIVLKVPNQEFSSFLEHNYSGVLESSCQAILGAHVQLEILTSSANHPSQATTTPANGSLESKYIFENFVVGASNRFAHAAGLAVSKSPGIAYNPLFLYGGVGLGKTHLLHAIGNQTLQLRQNMKVVYLTAEQFVNDLINSLRFKRMHEFRERYRKLDLLLLDDIQFFARKEQTKEEFFHTFNSLYNAKKQIVVSSDSPPSEIPTLPERLISRFEWGLLADIQAPDLETKLAILEQKAAAEKIELQKDVAEFIASNTRSNVRELEGALKKISAYSSLMGKTVDIEFARKILPNLARQENRTVTLADIVKKVADYYQIDRSLLTGKGNRHSISFPRQVAIYLCKQLTGLSYTEIAAYFNNRHHTTLLHAVKRIQSLIDDDEEFATTMKKFVENLR